MSASGVNYFVENYASFDYEQDWKIWLDFKNVTLPNIMNRASADSLYTGVIAMNPPLPTNLIMFSENDYLRVPSGKSGGVRISPATGIWSDNFSLIFLNKKETIGKTILFNCLTTGTLDNYMVYQGYRIGYTDSNKPFFEYYDNQGLKTFVADFNLPTTHSLNFVKSEDSLSIGYYDMLSQRNNTKSFGINSSYLLEPTGGQYFLGYTLNGLDMGGFSNAVQNSSGVVGIDEFLYFKRALYDYDIQIINSGFIADYVLPATGLSYFVSTGITGYSTGVVSIFSGITGYGITGTGYLTNDFGVQYTGYLMGSLTGNITGLGVTPLTGLIYTPYNSTSGGNLAIYTGYLKEFYNSGACFLKNLTSQDLMEVVAETGNTESIKNSQIGIYDITKRQFKIFDNTPSSVFLNGQLITSGLKINSGTIYSPIWSLQGDYLNTGSYIDFLGKYNADHSVQTLNVNQNIKLNIDNFSYTGGSPSVLSGVINQSNSLVFFNGLMVQSGDYKFSGNSLVFTSSFYDGITGKLVVLDVSGIYARNTGHFNMTITKNNPYYSMIYQNGQKLILNSDYLAISPYSLLNNSGIFQQSSTELYNDISSQDKFWN